MMHQLTQKCFLMHFWGASMLVRDCDCDCDADGDGYSQYVATCVLAMGIANSAAERNWKVHSFIQSKQRNGCQLKEKMEQKGACGYTYSSDEEFGP